MNQAQQPLDLVPGRGPAIGAAGEALQNFAGSVVLARALLVGHDLVMARRPRVLGADELNLDDIQAAFLLRVLRIGVLVQQLDRHLDRAFLDRQRQLEEPGRLAIVLLDLERLPHAVVDEQREAHRLLAELLAEDPRFRDVLALLI